MMRTLGLALLLAWLPVTGKLHAQAADETAPERSQETAADTADTSAGQPRPPPAADSSTFNPSEKIRADSAVSFPVDI